MPTLQVNGATIAFTDTGSPASRPDAPTIVFGHGLLFSGWMFSDQIEALRGQYRCVAIDWRGQGASPPAADGKYDMDTLALDAAAVIESLGAGPVHYVGLSMGGFVGMRLAARRPELIRSLTLIDTSAAPEEPSAALQDKALAILFRGFGLGPVRGPVQKIMFAPPFLADPRSPGLIDEWLAQVAKQDRAAESVDDQGAEDGRDSQAERDGPGLEVLQPLEHRRRAYSSPCSPSCGSAPWTLALSRVFGSTSVGVVSRSSRFSATVANLLYFCRIATIWP